MKYYIIFIIFTLLTFQGKEDEVAIQILKCGDNGNRQEMIFYANLRVENDSFVIGNTKPKSKDIQNEITNVVTCLNEKVNLDRVPMEILYHKYDQGSEPLSTEKEFREKYDLGKEVRLLYFSHIPGIE